MGLGAERAPRPIIFNPHPGRPGFNEKRTEK